jgi:ABC-type hemin transport system substrate-binding protein
MSQPAIIIPPELVKLIEERHHIRAAFAESRRQATTLEQFAGQVPGSSTIETIAPLTREATPPQEITAVLSMLEQQLSDVKQLEARIQGHHTAIKKIKRKARNIMFILVVSGIALFIILLLFLSHTVRVF